ncbi:MAG TPA: acetylxylan esterase [Thermomicrobiales bacterium]|nr:acetylxylan esterase [Thermomicrobiales bacterium]
MAFFDLPLDQLRAYRPEREEPSDFDAFWARTLEETHTHRLDATFHPIDTGLRAIETFDVTFAGFGGHPIKAWLQVPRGATTPVPCVVEFIGYGGGRARPHDWLLWSAAGYAHFIMDTRGQGSSWLPGDTPDPAPAGEPHFPGFMTRGILNPEHHYYRRVYADAVRAVEAARSHPAVDRDRVAVSGRSQGGGISVAVSGLIDDLAAVMPDVPFLSHIRRATEITDAHPYQEIARYCVSHRDEVERVFETLAHIDGMHFASRAIAPALFSVGLMDEICPPSTVFATFNHYSGPKEINVWRYNHHEGGGTLQTAKQLRFLNGLWN